MAAAIDAIIMRSEERARELIGRLPEGTYSFDDYLDDYGPGTPPIRVAATSADTFVSIGRQGLPIFVAVRYETAPEIAPHIAAYREAVRTAEDPQGGGVFLRVPAYIAATDALVGATREIES